VNVIVLPEAELEASEAAVWYEDQAEGLGGDFLTEVRIAFKRIGQAPQAAAVLESYSGPFEVRRYRLKRFPYLVIYSCRPAEAIVVAVSHVRRDSLYWLERLGPPD
jgi:toxin ParE1/3/4